MPPFAHKVFGIGLSKTGTKSLAAALEILGIPSVHFPPTPQLESALQRFQGLTDIPIAARYRELDQRFPGAKFILTIREREAWRESAARHFTGRPQVAEWMHALRVELYGAATWDFDSYSAGYRMHNENVRMHFKDRPQDLLVLDVAAGEGWEKLCPFLRLPVPATAFPHLNRRASP